MSSRTLRKLKIRQELDAHKSMNNAKITKLNDEKDEQNDENEEEHDDPVIGTGNDLGIRAKLASNQNPFDLLNNSCSESEVEDDKVTESSISHEMPSNEAGVDIKGTKSININLTKKNKMKNLKRREDKKVNVASNNDLHEIDKINKKTNRGIELSNAICSPVSIHSNVKGKRFEAASDTNSSIVLKIDAKYLNPDNEMKKIFGSRVVMAEKNQQARGTLEFRGNRTLRSGQVRSRNSNMNPNSLIVSKLNLSRLGKTGLSMKLLASDGDGNQYFTFEHNATYQSVQREFFVAVQSMNPESISQLLNANPFHIDSMLQLSDICKMGDDNQTAIDLIERALYVMECAFHPIFKLTSGTSRLDYKHQVNRAYYLALFRHINFVGTKGCYKTALELCKLTLSFDPSGDPLGITLIIDFYAIRAKQYDWLLRFYSEWENVGRNLSQLPNFAYSIAIAYFFTSKQGGKDRLEKDNNEEETRNKSMMDSANNALQNALIMFPEVLLPLLDKCSIRPDKVASHTFFREAQDWLNSSHGSSTESQLLPMLCNLYVGRSFHLWKDPDLLPWLEENVAKVIERVDNNYDGLMLTLGSNRQIKYQWEPRNIHRHVALSDIKEASSGLPRYVRRDAMLSYDPLPPIVSIDTYENSEQPLSGSSSLSETSLYMDFVRSVRNFIPNYNTNSTASNSNGENVVGAHRGQQDTAIDGPQRNEIGALIQRIINDVNLGGNNLQAELNEEYVSDTDPEINE